MASTFTPEALQGIIYAAYPAVLNKKSQIKADRKAMPFWNFLSKNEGNAPVAGATATGINGPTLKYQLTSDLDIQGFERRDVLAFSEGPIELETIFPWSNVHMGQEFVHEDLEAACGITIVPNQARTLFKNVSNLVGQKGIPRIVSGFGQEPFTEVAEPQAGISQSVFPVVETFTVRLTGDAQECNQRVSGSGFRLQGLL